MADRTIAFRIAIRDAENSVRILKSFGDAGENELARIQTAAAGASRSLESMDAASVGSERGFRRLGASAVNVGQQIQDIAVQAQAGTASLTILAQQGPQILTALNFSPLTAVFAAFAGSALAVGAATGALDGIFGATGTAAERLEKAQKALNDTFLGGASNAEEMARQMGQLSAGLRAVETARAGFAFSEFTSQIREEMDLAVEAVDRAATDIERRWKAAIRGLREVPGGDNEGPDQLERLPGAPLIPQRAERLGVGQLDNLVKKWRENEIATDEFGGSVAALFPRLKEAGDNATDLGRQFLNLVSALKQAEDQADLTAARLAFAGNKASEVQLQTLARAGEISAQDLLGPGSYRAQEEAALQAAQRFAEINDQQVEDAREADEERRKSFEESRQELARIEEEFWRGAERNRIAAEKAAEKEEKVAHRERMARLEEAAQAEEAAFAAAQADARALNDELKRQADIIAGVRNKILAFSDPRAAALNDARDRLGPRASESRVQELVEEERKLERLRDAEREREAAARDAENAARAAADEQRRIREERARALDELAAELDQEQRRTAALEGVAGSLRIVNREIEVENELRRIGLQIGTTEAADHERRIRDKLAEKEAQEAILAAEEKRQEIARRDFQRSDQLRRSQANTTFQALQRAYELDPQAFISGSKSVEQILEESAGQHALELGAIYENFFERLAEAGADAIDGLRTDINGLDDLFVGIAGGIGDALASIPAEIGGAVFANMGAQIAEGLVGALENNRGLQGILEAFNSPIGAASLGAFGGGILANITGGNQAFGQLGGGIGAGLGFAAGGPLGGLLGGFGGSVLGGLFGGQRDGIDNQQAFLNTVSGDLRLIGDSNAENAEATRRLGAAIADFAIQVEGLGGNLSARLIELNINTKNLGRAEQDLTELVQRLIRFDDPRSAEARIAQNSTATTLADLLQDLQFAQVYEDLTRASTEYRRALEAVRDQYLPAIAQAKRFGLNIDALRKGFQEASAEVAQSFRDQVTGFVAANIDNIDQVETYRIAAFQREADAAAELGRELGISERLIEQARRDGIDAIREQVEAEREARRERLRAAEEAVRTAEDALRGQADAIRGQFETIFGGIERTLDEMTTGRLSALNPEAQFGASLQDFRRTALAAQRGDLDAASRLGELGRSTLELGRTFTGGAGNFGAISDEIRRALERTQQQGQQSLERAISDIPAAYRDGVDRSIEAMRAQTREMVGELGRVRRELQDLRQEVRANSGLRRSA